MKKLVLLLAVVFGMSMVSCTNTENTENTENAATEATEIVETAEEVVNGDSTTVTDTTKVEQAPVEGEQATTEAPAN